MRLQGQQNSNNSLHIKFVFGLSLLCFLSSSIIEKQQTHFLKSLTIGHTTLSTAQGAGRAASKRICVRARVCQQHIVCIKCLKEICRPKVPPQRGRWLSGGWQTSDVFYHSFSIQLFLILGQNPWGKQSDCPKSSQGLSLSTRHSFPWSAIMCILKK